MKANRHTDDYDKNHEAWKIHKLEEIDSDTGLKRPRKKYFCEEVSKRTKASRLNKILSNNLGRCLIEVPFTNFTQSDLESPNRDNSFC